MAKNSCDCRLLSGKVRKYSLLPKNSTGGASACGGDQGDTEMADDQQKAIGKEDQSDGGGGAGTPGRLTFEEKRKLSLDIGKLSHDKLGKVVEIIKKRKKVADDEEIEIDIDSLGESTLRELEKYAAECLNPTKPVNLLSVFFCLCFS